MGPDPSWRVAVALALASARTIPLAWFGPALGGPGPAAARIRVALGLLLAVLCLPSVLPEVTVTSLAIGGVSAGPGARAAPDGGQLGAVGWVVLIARELAVGSSVGLVAGAIFRASEAAGRLVDGALGASFAPVGPVTSGEPTTPMAGLYELATVAVFLEIGGLRVLAVALARGYEAAPIGAAWATSTLGSVAELAVKTTALLMESAVGLAAPVLVAMWLVDGALGVAGRAVPRLAVHAVAMPLKALLGLGLVLAGMGVVGGAIAAGWPAWADLLARAFAVWRARAP